MPFQEDFCRVCDTEKLRPKFFLHRFWGDMRMVKMLGQRAEMSFYLHDDKMMQAFVEAHDSPG